MQVESLKSTLESTVQYSNSKINKVNYSNSTVTVGEVISNLSDIIPEDGYTQFYVNQYQQLGYKRFMELANLARKSGKNPARLFCWMLKNNKIVVAE